MTVRRAAISAPTFLSAVLVDAVGNGLFLPISILYFTVVGKVGLGTVGILLSAASLLTLPLPILVGAMVDQFGARPMVIAAHLVQAAGFVGYFAVGGPVTLAVFAGTVAVGQRVFWSSIFTLVSDVAATDQGAVDRWFARVGMLRAAGYGLGALVTSAVLSIGSPLVYRLTILANAASFLIAAGLIAVSTPHGRGGGPADRKKAGGYRILLADRRFLGVVVANYGFALCSVFLAIAVPVYVVDATSAPKWVVGPLLAVSTAVLAVGQTIAVRMVRTVARTTVLAVSGVLWVGWSAGMALSSHLSGVGLVVLLFAATLCYTAAELLHNPVSNALVRELSPAEFRGRYLAMFQYSFTFATITAPALFTLSFGWWHTMPWIVLAVVAAVASVMMVTLRKSMPDSAVWPAGSRVADEAGAM
jgi:MFS family permease